MEVIGAAGAILGIIDVATRSISTLLDVKKRFKEANLTLELLSSQLLTVKAALEQIHAIINETLRGDEQHYSLIMSMDSTIKCCNLLIRLLDENIAKLEYSENDALSFENRVRLVLDSKGIEECQSRLDRQINALNLILTAFQCRNTAKQRDIVEEKQSQKVWQQMRDDTTSLIVLSDSDSFVTKRTRTTTATSKLSINFAFDSELLQHKAYKSTLRSLMRRSRLRNDSGKPAQQDGWIDPLGPQERSSRFKTSQTIDKTLEADSWTLRRQARILVLGTESRDVMIALSQHAIPLPRDKAKSYRSAIYRRLIDEVVFAFATSHMPEQFFWPELRDNLTILEEASAKWTGLGSPESVMEALRFCSKHIPSTHDSMDEHSMIPGLDRMLDEDYIPTVTDLMKCPSRFIGIKEFELSMGQLSLLLTSMDGQRSERKKWIHSFEDAVAIIFTVDLSSYNQVLLHDSTQNELQESIQLFESVVNSQWFRRASVILFLTNVDVMRAKLFDYPLSDYFSDYSGGNDVNMAAKYILWRFNQVNKRNLRIYPDVSEHCDSNSVENVFSAVKETILQNALDQASDVPSNQRVSEIDSSSV